MRRGSHKAAEPVILDRGRRTRPGKLGRITASLVARARTMLRRRSDLTVTQEPDYKRLKDEWLKRIQPPPGVGPPEKDKRKAFLAMDEAVELTLGWAAQNLMSVFAEGLTFLGYAYLSELAQRPEYRKPVEIIATEMTREWIELKGTGDDESQTEKIAALKAELDRLHVAEVFRKAAADDGFQGRAHIYIDTGDTKNPDELKKPIGDGSKEDKLSAQKVNQKKPVVALRNVEAIWVYPTGYDSTDPLSPSWYQPVEWWVMSKAIHTSRLLTIIGREVPDLLKPAYSFGGLALSQMLKPYVDNWLNVRQSVADIIKSFTTWVLMTDMGDATLAPEFSEFFERINLFGAVKDNTGVLAIDKTNEDFKNISAPLGTLDALQAQTQEHMAAVAGIPLVKLFGIQPMGLNASSEGEIRTFYDWINAYQEHLFRVPLTTVIGFVQLSLWGEIDPDITFQFKKLYALTEKEQAEVDKTRAETAAVHIESGVLSQLEERTRVATDPNTQYQGLDIEDVPEMPENIEGKPFNARKTVGEGKEPEEGGDKD